MFGWEYGCAGFWWIFPIIMFVFMIACIFMMRGSSCMSGWHFTGGRSRRYSAGSAEDILDKRYALGEIDQKEYEEIKSKISRPEKNGS